MTETIYKLADREEWEAARLSGLYAGSTVDKVDGYIHFSTMGQLAETARRHYAGRRNLILAEIDVSSLGPVRWEPSRGGDLFPHLYGPLPFDAVRRQSGLRVDAEGVPFFDDGTVGWP